MLVIKRHIPYPKIIFWCAFVLAILVGIGVTARTIVMALQPSELQTTYKTVPGRSTVNDALKKAMSGKTTSPSPSKTPSPSPSTTTKTSPSPTPKITTVSPAPSTTPVASASVAPNPTPSPTTPATESPASSPALP